MPNFKSQAKRKRELAKLDKRQAKEQKRAVRKGERSGVAAAPAAAIAPPMPNNQRPVPDPATAAKSMTFAEAIERWKNTKVAKPKKR